MRRSKTIAIAAVFSGLCAIGNMIGATSIVSLESIFTFVCAALFGPVISVISAVAGELLSMAIFPPSETMFFWTTIAADAFTALIIAYGRLFAFPLEDRRVLSEKRARILSESVFYVLAVSARYAFYQLSDVIALNIGWLAPKESNTIDQQVAAYGLANAIRWFIKVAMLPICVIVVEMIRKNTQTTYFDIERVRKEVSS
ncbi:MAG: hypothetical protein JW839_21060 [Candidatus Lokiarchaeota archaeon]|nr:hypothetical protein [Candidatus Lokiarchaeota archaeon]